MEAVDDFMGNMLAYPGRTFGQLYHRFFRVNELADGQAPARRRARSTSPTCTCRCSSVAGEADVLAPVPAVQHVANLLPNAAEVETRRRPAATSAC